MQTGMCLMRKSRRGVGNLRMGEKTGLNVELEDKIKAQLCAYCKHSFKAKYYRQKHLCITLWIFVFYKDEKTVQCIAVFSEHCSSGIYFTYMCKTLL